MNKKIGKEILDWLICILIALVVALLIRYYLLTPTVVQQVSMYPTLESGDRLLLNRWVRTTNGELKRGDIVTFEMPSKFEFTDGEIDKENQVAIYDKNFSNGFERFCYYFLEIGKTSYIKRVIALPGEHIVISKQGDVYINGQKLEESYLQEGLKTQRSGKFYDLIVPEGYFFLMGDNREQSMDCRVFGCIPKEKIEGKVMVRFWPFEKMGNV